MKNYTLLFLICGAFAIAPLAAQKSLPASIQPYSVNWSYAVKQNSTCSLTRALVQKEPAWIQP